VGKLQLSAVILAALKRILHSISCSESNGDEGYRGSVGESDTGWYTRACASMFRALSAARACHLITVKYLPEQHGVPLGGYSFLKNLFSLPNSGSLFCLKKWVYVCCEPTSFRFFQLSAQRS